MRPRRAVTAETPRDGEGERNKLCHVPPWLGTTPPTSASGPWIRALPGSVESCPPDRKRDQSQCRRIYFNAVSGSNQGSTPLWVGVLVRIFLRNKPSCCVWMARERETKRDWFWEAGSHICRDLASPKFRLIWRGRDLGKSCSSNPEVVCPQSSFSFWRCLSFSTKAFIWLDGAHPHHGG